MKTVAKVEDTKAYGKLFGVYTSLGIDRDGEVITETKSISGKFGVKKARAILAHIPELQKFVDSHDNDEV